jgi:hypothetical protein
LRGYRLGLLEPTPDRTPSGLRCVIVHGAIDGWSRVESLLPCHPFSQQTIKLASTDSSSEACPAEAHTADEE